MLSVDSHPKTVYLYQGIQTSRPINYAHVWKRVFDVCFALFVIVFILSWMVPLVGLLILLDTPGPVMYVQKRTGYRGRWFHCLKFRTMKQESKAEFRQATQSDQRITFIGRFLRKTNVDEMPQFINVLMGEMSVVGPRPHALQHSAQYWNTMPEYHKRYREKPGITGLAQVRGCRGETERDMKMRHRIRYDRFYNRKRTLTLDLWICGLTLTAMLKGDINAW